MQHNEDNVIMSESMMKLSIAIAAGYSQNISFGVFNVAFLVFKSKTWNVVKELISF